MFKSWVLRHYSGYREIRWTNDSWGTHMHKSALVLAVTLAACFTLTDAEAAKKRKAEPAKPADAAYEWNVKNVPPMATPGAAKPADAAKPAKAAKRSKKKAKKS